MDKKNTLIGVVLLLAAFGMLFYGSKVTPPPPQAPTPAVVSESSEEKKVVSEGAQEIPNVIGQQPVAQPAQDLPMIATAEALPAEEEFVTLENDFVRVHLSNHGGAIENVVLKEFAAVKGEEAPYVFNELHLAPVLSLMDFPSADRHAVYSLHSQSRKEVVFRIVVEDHLEILRSYSISDGKNGRDPYEIRHETTFRNLTDRSLVVPTLAYNLGTSAPISAKDTGQYLNVGYYDGDDADFIKTSAFEASPVLSKIGIGSAESRSVIKKQQATVWASVKNQFFTSVITPDIAGVGIKSQRVEFPLIEGELKPRIGITGSIEMRGLQLASGAQERLGFDCYVGPKEYSRLTTFENRQDLVMEFGFFGFFSKLLLTLMTFIYGIIPNYGVAIILTTLVLKTLLWPVNAKAAKSAKNMAKFQGPMKEIREKYKDNPQKQQKAMMELYKEHKINPVAGCLPMFVQIPIFFGFFRMLQSASELRFAEFLWATDLSGPDTVGHIFGFPINIFVLLMGITSFFQMKMMPMPSVDNAQAKIFKFMPIIMVVMLYTFSSGLALYWTAQNLFTIGQQALTNRKNKEDEVEIIPPTTKKKKSQPANRKKKRNR
jgi:YidC/Oxa1 family membrane protein insertase